MEYQKITDLNFKGNKLKRRCSCAMGDYLRDEPAAAAAAAFASIIFRRTETATLTIKAKAAQTVAMSNAELIITI